MTVSLKLESSIGKPPLTLNLALQERSLRRSKYLQTKDLQKEFTVEKANKFKDNKLDINSLPL